ncbi:UV-resistance associated gene isoform X3 [Rhodnius prolixus]|uniref:UV-resistance associated gene isoform X3 n=1 Tax=Rhodnius prolixus TaxID=13249 RepID=UPI003D18D9B8
MKVFNKRGIVRWKEWIPLVTQQQRLRNLIQIIAYNIQVPEEVIASKTIDTKLSYYYTLHLTTMSSPLYISEKLESENPKWSEIEIESANGAANGVVIRLWMHGLGSDRVITSWGLYFSGLVYIGTRLVGTDLSVLGPNTFVFHMHGGYFTGQHCFLDGNPVVTPRTLTIQLDASQVKPSYSVGLLCRLHSLQQTVRKRSAAATVLKEQIMAGCLDNQHFSGTATNKGRESLALRRLMSKPAQVRPQPKEILEVRKEIELLKFRLQLLSQEKERCEQTVQQLFKKKDQLSNENKEISTNLIEKYCTLNKEIENCKEFKRQLIEVKSQLSHTTALLDVRRKELMSELSIIYPIKQKADGQYTIRGVHLPDSEDFNGKDELMISVALGFVAHLVQMMAYFLNVPTRYPVCHFGSRSKIIDHIIDTIPDKDREFPLYSKGKEKLPFDYGVYLLNKNIAQLRWCCGLTTEDLRQTLQNLAALMTLDRKSHQSSREWQRIRRGHGAEDEGDYSRRRTQMCRSLDYGLDKCTITPSRHTDSDPQDYLQNRDSFLPLSIDHQNYPSISPTPSPQLEKEEQELPNWNLATLKSESLSQTNCTLIIPSPANCETGPCLKEDT